jgi:hypothetical protein
VLDQLFATKGSGVDKTAVFVGLALIVIAGVVAVRVAHLQRAERRGQKNPDRVPFEDIRARVERERAIEWPTASDLQRHGERGYGEPLPAVRVPPYVLPDADLVLCSGTAEVLFELEAVAA